MDSRQSSARRGLRKRGFRVGAALAAVAGAAVCLAAFQGCQAVLVFSPSPQLPASTVSPVKGSPIQHIVIIMQENRSFDNLFNGFPGADTTTTGVSHGTTIPLKPISLGDSRDLNHSHKDWWRDWNHGEMDGFEQEGASPSRLPYSYVRREEVKSYWDLARQYAIGDRMFQANTGPSFVAHQYMIAGQSGRVAENPTGSVWGCDANPSSRAALLGPDPSSELPGVFPCFDYRTIGDLLDKRGVTWRYYAPAADDSFFILSAYQAVRHIRYGSDWQEKVISPQSRVLTDLAHGELAQVTWIVPDWSHSDHPGSGSEGPEWVASIVNAIGNSQFWNSTAIFIAWDDWGGWYDHVAPPYIDDMGPGFRVPVLVVSPWARHGYVSHQFHEVSGFLAFVEKNFGLPDLGARDAGADNFDDCFDYTQTLPAFVPLNTRLKPDDLLRERPSGPPDDD